eukprot:CAMPEP_0181316032 /NCGR_PEP_ID=MMETSP1101-20121128/15681_1 /TAXON_ID=46948 /ORGANISM="Rhodomonas abbreviata, Strain Caron Lab Isolate" /LENGTH=273 /DNA_ID=CAMNT_0023423257 /DNA_START=80 /DNA_END=901 /DNA_ORIENTATION=-
MTAFDEQWNSQAERILKVAGSDPSGYVGRLTESEKACLHFISSETAKVHPDHRLKDKDFLRFLRACEFNQKNALKALLADIEWRTAEKPWEITLEEVRGPFDNGNFLPVGVDRRGRPTMYFFGKQHDPKMSKQSSKLVLYTMEQKCREIEESEEESFTLVFDLTGYGLKNSDSAWCWTVISRLQKSFPERLGTCLILNAPRVFGLLWSVIKPWIAKRTSDKILFVDGDYQAKLKAFIADDNIPVLLGGTMDITPQRYIAQHAALSAGGCDRAG